MVNQVATMEPRRSVTTEMATRYGMEPAAFEATLRATVFPRTASKEEFAAFLLIAKEYKLNPMTREIYAFPKKGGGLSFVVSVDGWSSIINSHPAANGMTFRDLHDPHGNLLAVTCQMWRKDREHPIEATEYMAECRRGTDPWRQWPRRMLRHKALVQAARYAFGLSGVVDQDDAERFERTYPADKRATPTLTEALKLAAVPRPPEPAPAPPQPIPPQPEEEEEPDDDAARIEGAEDYSISARDDGRERLFADGVIAAEYGTPGLHKWAATLMPEERDLLGDDYAAELANRAREADAAGGGGVT